jgi:pterin-4a-carbinolamine dehydratase
VNVTLTTHDFDGLSKLDMTLASKMDKIASTMSEEK